MATADMADENKAGYRADAQMGRTPTASQSDNVANVRVRTRSRHVRAAHLISGRERIP